MSVPFFTPDVLAQLQTETKAAVLHILATGELPPGADPMTEAEALALLRGFWGEHGPTFAEATIEFAFGLVELATLPAESIEDFEARLTGLSPDQLAEIAELDAAASEQAVNGIVDRRRALVEALGTTSLVLVKGGLATALNLVLPGAGTAAAEALDAATAGEGEGEGEETPSDDV